MGRLGAVAQSVRQCDQQTLLVFVNEVCITVGLFAGMGARIGAVEETRRMAIAQSPLPGRNQCAAFNWRIRLAVAGQHACRNRVDIEFVHQTPNGAKSTTQCALARPMIAHRNAQIGDTGSTVTGDDFQSVASVSRQSRNGNLALDRLVPHEVPRQFRGRNHDFLLRLGRKPCL